MSTFWGAQGAPGGLINFDERTAQPHLAAGYGKGRRQVRDEPIQDWVDGAS